MAASIETDLGLVEEARASAHAGLAQSEAIGNEAFRLLCLGVLGRLELALGDVRVAGGYLRELPGRLLASGMNDPTQPIWADAIETLIALGELEQARVYLEAYEQSSRGSGSPWAAVCALRCRAMLTAAENDLASAFEAYDRTLAQLTSTRFRSNVAGRCSCGLGATASAAEKAVRQALEQALAIFEQSGRGCGRRRPGRSWHGSAAGGRPMTI